MDKTKAISTANSGFMTLFLFLAIQEITNFIRLDGLNNPIAFCLLKIILYLFGLIIFYRNQATIDYDKLREALSLVMDELRKKHQEEMRQNQEN